MGKWQAGGLSLLVGDAGKWQAGVNHYWWEIKINKYAQVIASTR